MCRPLILGVLSILFGLSLLHAGDEPASKPNFVFIMADASVGNTSECSEWSGISEQA